MTIADDGPSEIFSIEKAFAQLEELLQRLESGGLSLEQSIQLYEDAMTLVRQCEDHLRAAELRIEQIQFGFQDEPVLFPSDQ